MRHDHERERVPYLTGISATLSAATLVAMLNLIREVRDNARERVATQDDRLKGMKEDLERTGKWHAVEKSKLRGELDRLTAELNNLLDGEGIDVYQLAMGKQLSKTAEQLQNAAELLVTEIGEKLERMFRLDQPKDGNGGFRWQLSLAMGAMASGAYGTAASQFDAYVERDHLSWTVHFARGVAHANVRGGAPSDLSSLRAYNDAIALAPPSVEVNQRARMFTYRAAMLKRLGRLPECEADLNLALELASDDGEILDIRYNRACLYAMQLDRTRMMDDLRAIACSPRYRAAVQAHYGDYFAAYATDPEVRAVVG